MTVNPPDAETVDASARRPNGQLASPSRSAISDDEQEPELFTRALQDSDSLIQRSAQIARQEDGGPSQRRPSNVLKLSMKQIHDLTTSPDSIPLRVLDDDIPSTTSNLLLHGSDSRSVELDESDRMSQRKSHRPETSKELPSLASARATLIEAPNPGPSVESSSANLSQPNRTPYESANLEPPRTPVETEEGGEPRPNGTLHAAFESSSIPAVLPIPPLSLPTHLHLELSSEQPSALYIHRSAAEDSQYESAQIKFERLLNFIFLPPSLEEVLWFGALACLDAWLYTFTILPLRFIRAIWILVRWFGQNAVKEVLDLGAFVYHGLGRVWERNSISSVPNSRRSSQSDGPVGGDGTPSERSTTKITIDTKAKPNGHVSSLSSARRPISFSSKFRHVRRRSTPSALRPSHKADILQGMLILASCAVLMQFDASRVYHSIRGQSTVKLYVLYNAFEVFDRLFSAFGQDVLECLLSKETLERDSNGRSRIFRPLWMFVLALIYNVIHATALFYQVITLNVAVNSYSHALLTLLMSNQFVEIRGTVFKKFERENLFQLTCADIVERFQLWLMLMVIVLRNVVEVGGISISLSSALGEAADASAAKPTSVPLTTGFAIPQAFQLLPKWTGEVFGPFLIVLGSEALVDWCKHAYITKFNSLKPHVVYGRFLDVLAKDYYTHAFADQNLTKRLGLPVIPLCCLFLRACIQTYHMFLAAHVPVPPPPTTSISLESDAAAESSRALTAALRHIDHVFRRALGRSSFGGGGSAGAGAANGALSRLWSLDDFIALATMVIFFLAAYLVLLILKLALGMALLAYARSRYQGMKERERESTDTQGKWVGGWGTVEVSEDKQRRIYEDDPQAFERLRQKEEERGRAREAETKLGRVHRYSMVAKRIW